MSIPAGAYVTTAEAARELGITRGRIQHSAIEGGALSIRLRMVKPGRDWLIPREALDAEISRRAAQRDIERDHPHCVECGNDIRHGAGCSRA